MSNVETLLLREQVGLVNLKLLMNKNIREIEDFLKR